MGILINRLKKAKLFLIITLIVISSLTLASFSFKFFTIDKATEQIKNIESALIQIKAAMNVDSVRQYNLQKAITLINRYNPSISGETRYNIANEIYEMSIKYANLDVDLICATISHESAYTWKTDIVSKAGAMGLMQIMPATGIFLADAEGIQWTKAEDTLFNPIYNIRLGCRYLSTLITLYELDGGLAAYNGGERRAALWLKKGKDNSVLWEETRDYVPAVLQLYEEYTN